MRRELTPLQARGNVGRLFAQTRPQPRPVVRVAQESLLPADALDLIAQFQRARTAAPGTADAARRGGYWGITTKIGAYGLKETLARDSDVTGALQLIRTRLNEFSPKEQGQLINWGYALTDAAMRAWVVPDATCATAWPIAEFAL